MIIGRVVGSVWATKKEDHLEGIKFLIVQPLTAAGQEVGPTLVAGDRIGAGIGELVLVTRGSSARKAFRTAESAVGREGGLGREVTDRREITIDAAVIGIIDNIDLDPRAREGGW